MQPISEWSAKQLKLLATVATASTSAGGEALTLDSPLIAENVDPAPLSSADLHLHDSVDALHASFAAAPKAAASAVTLDSRAAFVSQLLSDLTALSPLELRLLRLLDKERTKRWELQSELDMSREMIDKIRNLVKLRSGDAPKAESVNLPAAAEARTTGKAAAAKGDAVQLVRNRRTREAEAVPVVALRSMSQLLTDDDDTGVVNVPPMHVTKLDKLTGTAVPTVSQPLQCEVCEADDGDFLVACSTCRALRHEACGGVRPDDAMMLCKACRDELNMGSDNKSELRSQTTTEDHISENSDDDDTSLSGFIVRTEDMTTSSESGSFELPTSEDDDEEAEIEAAVDDIRSPSQVKKLGLRTSGTARAAWKGLQATTRAPRTALDSPRGRLRGADDPSRANRAGYSRPGNASYHAKPIQPQKRRRAGQTKPTSVGGTSNEQRGSADVPGKKRRRQS